MKVCYNCNTEWISDGKPGRQETCVNCDFYLHCCLNCLFYNESSYNECRESRAERVIDKEKSNFCDYFTFKTNAYQDKPKLDTKKAFDDLFN
ncbi:MAG: hypothetical protein OEV44_04760 [Spirochaetota bacterium]|nr:hypothetical protein [Spirochaetota bacterium]